MHEKGIDFEPYLVNLPGQETQSPWYLQINPRGEVPAMKHGKTIISGSDKILEYIENQKLGKRSLVPEDSAELKRFSHWMSKLDALPIEQITFGTAYHPHIRQVKKGPIIGPILVKMKWFMDNRSAMLRQRAAEHKGTAAEEALLAKAETHDKNYHLITSEVQYKRILKELEETLDEVEGELESHKERRWLTGDNFTAADCILAVTLNRIFWIGYENYVVSEKRPLLKQYWDNIQSRDSFVKSTYYPNLALYMFKDKIRQNSAMLIGLMLIPILSGLIYYGMSRARSK